MAHSRHDRFISLPPAQEPGLLEKTRISPSGRKVFLPPPQLALIGLLLTACGEPLLEKQLLGDSHAVVGGGVTIAHEPALGKGTNEEETYTRKTCIVFPDVRREPVPFQHRKFEEFSVTSRSQLNRKLGVSAELAAKALWGSASASASDFEKIDFDESSFYWVVNAKYELAHEALATGDPSFDLTERAKELLRVRGWSGFKEACGTHFYAGQRLGAHYAIVYEFQDTNDHFNQAISAKASGNYFGIVNGTAEFSRDVDSARAKKSMSVYADIVGGDSRVKEYAESPSALLSELTVLRESLGERNQGIALSWHKLPYDIFLEVQAAKEAENQADRTTVAINDILAELYDRFHGNKAKATRLRRARSDSEGSEPLVVYSDDQLAQIDDTVARLHTQNDMIERRAKQCIGEVSAETCNFDGLDFISSHPPAPIRDLSGLGDWSVYFIPDNFMYGKGKVFLNIYAIPSDTAKSPRLFYTDHRIIRDSNTHIYAYAGKQALFRDVGEDHSRDLRPGVTQPIICTGATSDLCSFRFVERAGTTSDGLPNADLLLTVYDSNGRILQKNFFHQH